MRHLIRLLKCVSNITRQQPWLCFSRTQQKPWVRKISREKWKQKQRGYSFPPKAYRTLLHEKGFINNTKRQMKANIYSRERSSPVKQVLSWMQSQQPHLTVCVVFWQITLLHTRHSVRVWKVDEMDNTRMPIMKDLRLSHKVDFYCS